MNTPKQLSALGQFLKGLKRMPDTEIWVIDGTGNPHQPQSLQLILRGISGIEVVNGFGSMPELYTIRNQTGSLFQFHSDICRSTEEPKVSGGEYRIELHDGRAVVIKNIV